MNIYEQAIKEAKIEKAQCELIMTQEYIDASMLDTAKKAFSDSECTLSYFTYYRKNLTI